MLTYHFKQINDFTNLDQNVQILLVLNIVSSGGRHSFSVEKEIKGFSLSHIQIYCLKAMLFQCHIVNILPPIAIVRCPK